jgi:hypothetical protein
VEAVVAQKEAFLFTAEFVLLCLTGLMVALVLGCMAFNRPSKLLFCFSL